MGLEIAGMSLGQAFDTAKIIGSVEQDLNNYKCPSCGHHNFVRGVNSYLVYVQCLRNDCHRVDVIGPKLAAAS